MDLRQLAALVAVAETGTFSAAATTLHTVQSNVSTHIAHLERELGVTLVDRTASRLTDEGEVVLARARRVQAELDALTADVAALRDEVVGTVQMGVIGTTGRWLMAPFFTEMAERHPGVRVTAFESNTTGMLPQLLGGRLDLGVVNLPVDDPDVTVRRLFDEDLIVVAPSDHPLASHEVVGLAELADHPLLLTPPGTSIRVPLDAAAEKLGVTLQAKAELEGLRFIASLAFEGFGPAVLPASAVPRWLPDVRWRRVGIEGVGRRSVGTAFRRRGLPSAPARAVLEVVADVIVREASTQPGVHPVPVG